jgi:hypothetical protein
MQSLLATSLRKRMGNVSLNDVANMFWSELINDAFYQHDSAVRQYMEYQ